jgi:hypothetical protein
MGEDVVGRQRQKKGRRGDHDHGGMGGRTGRFGIGACAPGQTGKGRHDAAVVGLRPQLGGPMGGGAVFPGRAAAFGPRTADLSLVTAVFAVHGGLEGCMEGGPPLLGLPFASVGPLATSVR